MEHEIFHTESYFSVSSDELAKLAALTREFGTIEEMRIADLIANSLPQSRYAKDLHWDYLCKLSLHVCNVSESSHNMLSFLEGQHFTDTSSA